MTDKLTTAMNRYEIFDYGIKPLFWGRHKDTIKNTQKPYPDEVGVCREWIRQYVSKPRTKKRYKKNIWDSYELKHHVEATYESCYVSNGAFIQAGILEGYEPIITSEEIISCSFHMVVRKDIPYKNKSYSESRKWK